MDIPKIYTALAEWLSCLILISLVKKRYSIKITTLMSCVFLTLIIFVQYLIGIVPLVLWIPGMVVALAVMYIFIFSCSDLPYKDCLFLWAIAFIMAEFAASIEWQISSFLFTPASGKRSIPELVLMVISYAIIYVIFFLIEKRRFSKIQELQANVRELFSGIMISVCAFLISNISYVYQNTPFSGSMSTEIFYIRTLVDFAGVVMLISLQESIIGLHAERERDAMQNILQRQYANYQLSKESVALIHQKYHDLKHQIDVIRRETNAEKREEYLDEIESGIQDFEAQNKTGNAVLDTILTNKQLYCVQHGINLTSVVDGNLLAFVEVMDLCSIFGNALDNAIESVEKIADQDKRLIRLAVYRQNTFVMMRFENYYESAIQMTDEMPQTTKKNKAYHGYGIKSIYHIAEKYKGTAVIDTQDRWFQLSILLPIPEKLPNLTLK